MRGGVFLYLKFSEILLTLHIYIDNLNTFTLEHIYAIKHAVATGIIKLFNPCESYLFGTGWTGKNTDIHRSAFKRYALSSCLSHEASFRVKCC